MSECHDTNDTVNNELLYQNLSKFVCCEIVPNADDITYLNHEPEKLSTNFVYGSKKNNDSKHLDHLGYKNETKSKLTFPTGRLKPMIEKGKLKIIGSKYFQETNLKSTKNGFSHLVLNRELVKNGKPIQQHMHLSTTPDKAIKLTIRSSRVFNKEIKSEVMEDFKSLSLKANDPFSTKDHLCLCTELNSLSFSNEHRGNIKKISKTATSHKSGRKKLTDKELPDMNSLSISEAFICNSKLTCAEQARNYEDVSTDELAAYLDNHLHFPKKMSAMAEMMYT